MASSVGGVLLRVDVDDLGGRHAVEGGRVVGPIGSRTIDPDEMIRTKNLRKTNSLLLAIGILSKNDVRAVAACTIQNTRLGLLRRSRGMPLEGNLVGLVQSVKSADGEKDTRDGSTGGVLGDVDDVGLQPSSLGDEGTSRFSHDDQLDRPIRKDGREDVDGGFVVVDKRGSGLGRDTRPTSTNVGEGHGDAEFVLDAVEDATEELGKLDESVGGEVLGTGMTRETNESEAMGVGFFDDSEGHFWIDTKFGGERLVRTFAGRDKTTEGLDVSEDSSQFTTLTLGNPISSLNHTMDLRSAINSIVLNTNFNAPLKLITRKIAVAQRDTSRVNTSIDEWFSFNLGSAVKTTSKLVVDVSDGLSSAGLDGAEVNDVDVGGRWYGGHEVFDGVFDDGHVDYEEGLFAVLEGLSVVLREGGLDARGHLGWVEDGHGGSHDGDKDRMKGGGIGG
jgi:hypothetical protein